VNDDVTPADEADVPPATPAAESGVNAAPDAGTAPNAAESDPVDAVKPNE
jgi:hypothetical protein